MCDERSGIGWSVTGRLRPDRLDTLKQPSEPRLNPVLSRNSGWGGTCPESGRFNGELPLSGGVWDGVGECEVVGGTWCPGRRTIDLLKKNIYNKGVGGIKWAVPGSGHCPVNGVGGGVVLFR